MDPPRYWLHPVRCHNCGYDPVPGNSDKLASTGRLDTRDQGECLDEGCGSALLELMFRLEGCASRLTQLFYNSAAGLQDVEAFVMHTPFLLFLEGCSGSSVNDVAKAFALDRSPSTKCVFMGYRRILALHDCMTLCKCFGTLLRMI